MKTIPFISIISPLLISILLISLISSCKSKKSSELPISESKIEDQIPEKTTYHIDFPSVINQTKDVYLSDFAISVKYIPLETTLKYMIGESTVMVRPCAEYIFIGEHGKPVGVFDFNGNFLRTIGTIGKGPAEYNFDYRFWPDETTRKIYISNVNIRGISAYSFEGEHLENIVPDAHSMAFAPLGNDKFVSWTWRQQTHDEKLYRVFFHDNLGKIFNRVFEPEKEYDFSNGISIMAPLLTYAPTGVIYNSWEDNHIMRAKQDGSFEKVLSWNLGKFEMPFDPLSDYKRSRRERHKYINDINAWESNENWYIKYHYKKRLQLAVLNKRNEDFFVVTNPDTIQDGVFNDIDGGPSFWPFWYSDKGVRFFELHQAIDLMDGELSQIESIEPKNANAALALQELVATLNENSNPVLMIVEMK